MTSKKGEKFLALYFVKDFVVNGVTAKGIVEDCLQDYNIPFVPFFAV